MRYGRTAPVTYVVHVIHLQLGQTYCYEMVSRPSEKNADARRLFGRGKYDKFTIVPKNEAPAWMVAEAEETMTNWRD
jgi:hypothetical protein